jgi:hypothetical protein
MLDRVLVEKAPGFGLDDGYHVNRFHEILVLRVLFRSKGAFVGFLSQYVDVSLEFRVSS